MAKKILKNTSKRISKPKVNSKKPSRVSSISKTQIKEAAVRLFSEHGFDGVTVKDISTLAKTNVALVSYHFGSKEGLYRTCLKDFAEARLRVAQDVLRPSQSKEEVKLRLKMFIEDLLKFHSENTHQSIWIQRECEMGFPLAFDIFKGTFLKVFQNLQEFIRHAQELKIVSAQIDSHCLVSLLTGSLWNLVRMDRVTQRLLNVSIADPEYRNLILETWMQLFEGLILKSNGSQKNGKT